MSANYMLEGHLPKRVNDLLEWARWYEMADRRVAHTHVQDAEVSTVFLGLDHRFGPGEGTPVLFETMVFGSPFDEEQQRYCTWEEAETGHRETVERVRFRCGWS